jgi:hypothetical protein
VFWSVASLDHVLLCPLLFLLPYLVLGHSLWLCAVVHLSHDFLHWCWLVLAKGVCIRGQNLLVEIQDDVVLWQLVGEVLAAGVLDERRLLYGLRVY